MADTILSTRIATTDQELTVNLMADELHARGADYQSKASVVGILMTAGFREDRVEKHGYSAAMAAWYHYGGNADEWPIEGWGEAQ